MEETTDNWINLLSREYIETALRKYEEIKSMVSKRNRPTRYERELISMIFNKMVAPYYYCAEARVKGENENANNKGTKESSTCNISELVAKYDLDISEMNSTPKQDKAEEIHR